MDDNVWSPTTPLSNCRFLSLSPFVPLPSFQRLSLSVHLSLHHRLCTSSPGYRGRGEVAAYFQASFIPWRHLWPLPPSVTSNPLTTEWNLLKPVQPLKWGYSVSPQKASLLFVTCRDFLRKSVESLHLLVERKDKTTWLSVFKSWKICCIWPTDGKEKKMDRHIHTPRLIRLILTSYALRDAETHRIL